MLTRTRVLPRLIVIAMLLSSFIGLGSQAHAVPEVPGTPQNVEYSPITTESVTIEW